MAMKEWKEIYQALSRRPQYFRGHEGMEVADDGYYRPDDRPFRRHLTGRLYSSQQTIGFPSPPELERGSQPQAKFTQKADPEEC